MADAVAIDLERAFSWGGWGERAHALESLPGSVRRVLAFEWARAGAADARSVLSLYETRFPGDDRPRKAVEAAERVIATHGAAAAAADAAAAAAADADAAAADAAAADAVRAACAADAAARAARAAAAAAVAAVVADSVAAVAAAAAVAAVVADSVAAVAAVAHAAAEAAAAKSRWRWLLATYRHAVGPGYEFRAEWRTSDAVALARGICAERAFDRMPILADALQDAGCDGPELMRHLQTDRGEWTAADWCLWNLTDPEVARG